jgi:hypothetical protein
MVRQRRAHTAERHEEANPHPRQSSEAGLHSRLGRCAVNITLRPKEAVFRRGVTLLVCSLIGMLFGVSGAATAQVPSAVQPPQSGSQPRNRPRSSTSGPRTNLKPRLHAGDVMRYRIELQTTSQTTHTGAVADPQGPSQLVVTWDATVRLEVIDAGDTADPAAGSTATPARASGAAATAASPRPTAAPSEPNAVRIRTTYEKSEATIQSDTPDPAAEGIEKQYSQLEGHAIEFTLGRDGHISDIRGLEDVVSDEKARSAAEQWMAQLSGSASAPAAGIVPGQNWSSQEIASSIPLAGLIWRTDSSYLRNEACHAANPGGNASAPGGETCALILSRLALVPSRKSGDVTPEEYRRNGLHTEGHWTGSGESLSYISLKSGWVVSVTQTGAEQMDVTISNGADGVSVHYAGIVRTRSELSLLPSADPVPASAPPTPQAPSQTMPRQ